ncbi:MAG: HEAT repeat domain-containing protein [Hyphomicrobiales bacterium]
MSERQLDFFSDIDVGVEHTVPQDTSRAPVSSESMDDESLIAAIPDSSLADACNLAAEAGRRRLAAAVPALAALCRRFAGFGARRKVFEQAVAIEALAMIGGRDAADALSEMIERSVVQGPTMQIAASAAARLGSSLSSDALRRLLRDDEPSIRADACRCARVLPELISILIDLLDDLDRRVSRSAALALGRMGRIEARPIIKCLLWSAPSEDVIEAASSIADEECAVLLGRIARSASVLAEAALIGLENADHARAVAIVTGIRRLRLPPQSSDSDRAHDSPLQQSSS